jgi:hypothetical protein
MPKDAPVAHGARHAVPRHEKSQRGRRTCRSLSCQSQRNFKESPPWQFSPIPSPISSRVSKTPPAPATRNSPPLLQDQGGHRQYPQGGRLHLELRSRHRQAHRNQGQAEVHRRSLGPHRSQARPDSRPPPLCRLHRDSPRHVRPRHFNPFDPERRDVRRQRKASQTRRRTPRQRLVNP